MSKKSSILQPTLSSLKKTRFIRDRSTSEPNVSPKISKMKTSSTTQFDDNEVRFLKSQNRALESRLQIFEQKQDLYMKI